MQAHSNTSSDYCGTFHAAKLLGLSVGTVQSLVERGELSAWKTSGGHRRIALQSIYAYQARLGARPAMAERPPHPVSGSSTLRLLVVDDDESARELIRGWIEAWGLPIECTVKSSAMEALIEIGRSLPDLLITDLRMPGVDGFEFLRVLGSNPDYASVVLMVMTAMTEDEIATQGELPPGLVVAHKPLDAAWFKGFLSGALAHQRRARA